jgi:hypothetical protein
MATTQYTFWNLIQQYAIEIPIIQRDYAQGRKSEKVDEIRKNFIATLHKTIDNQIRLDFDFVYGSIQSNCFIPLDGQQRLTTLFLLHWYLATKDGQLEDLTVKANLSRFTYKTRSSSNEFCNDLIDKGIVFDDGVLSDKIKDASWFFQSWEKDPTVQSMLVMLDAIHDKFRNDVDFFKRLIDTNTPLVTFQFIELDNFGLSDGLYIKMNARGKALTDFENFKAKFEQFLEKNYSHKKNEFSVKIDGVWTDLFWKFKEESVIDKPFMRYFEFITEMLHYINSDEDYDKSQILEFDVYKTEVNVNFLFKSLDKFCFIEKNETITSFFLILFGSVPIFEQNTNLFIRCLQGKEFDIKEKILLFSIIEYLLKIDVSIVTESLKDCIRVIRNLVLRVRYRDGIEFRSNLRRKDLKEQLFTIRALIHKDSIYEFLASKSIKTIGFTDESLNFEKEKARIIVKHPALKSAICQLEDHPLLKGSIHNFDLPNHIEQIPIFYETFNKIWALRGYNNGLIIRTFMQYNDNYDIHVGDSGLGPKWFYGHSDKWETILTHPKRESKINLADFLIAFESQTAANQTVAERLESMISCWLKNTTSANWDDWRYYFAKYPCMTNTGYNLYSFKNNEANFELRNLTGWTLNARHINPYVRTVATKINDESICQLAKCSTCGIEASPLILEDGFQLYCEEAGWRIVTPQGFELSEHFYDNFTWHKDGDKIYLTEDENRDRIEVAIDFALC